MNDKSKVFYSPASAQFQPQENNLRLDLTLMADGGKVTPIMASYVFTKNNWLYVESFLIHPEFVFDLVEELISVEQRNSRR